MIIRSGKLNTHRQYHSKTILTMEKYKWKEFLEFANWHRKLEDNVKCGGCILKQTNSLMRNFSGHSRFGLL